jgi:hypothetical protein
MAKKKAAVAIEPSKERLTVFSLKGSPEYRDWLSTVSKKTLVSTAVIARDAIGKWATDRGFPPPPEV